MRQKSNSTPASSETLVRNIRRATRKHHAAEEKIRMVLDGLRGESSIAELCRREGIAESMYYSWSKEFLEAGKRRLAGDTARAATTIAALHDSKAREASLFTRELIPGAGVWLQPGITPCVKTLRGITAPGILGSTVTRRGKKTQKFVFRSALRPNQISFSHG